MGDTVLKVSFRTHTHNFNMNAYIISALALVAVVGAEPLFFAAPAAFVASAIPAGSNAATIAAITAANTAGAEGVAAAAAAVAGANVLGGVILLKGLAVGALAIAAASRSKRAADDNDAAFIVLANSEPAQCYHRLICALATGAMPKSEIDVILNLFSEEASTESPKFSFDNAAKLGKKVKDTQVCEIRYSCPLSTSDIQKFFN